MSRLKVVDLFAGAGGLSLGFEQTKKFEVVAAVEINKWARQTYEANKPGAKIYKDITKIDFDQIKKRFGKIDVVIGGPPCQGFSNANRQRNHLISGNNSLVKYFIKAIEELDPDAFVMENVKTMSSESHKFFLVEGEKEEIGRLGVKMNENEEILLGDTIFNHEVLRKWADRDDFGRCLLDEKVFSKLNSLHRVRLNESKLNKYLLKEKDFFNSLSHKIEIHHKESLSYEYHQVWRCMVSELKCCIAKEWVDDKLLRYISQVLEVQRILSKIKEVQDHHLQHQLILRDGNLYLNLISYNVFDFVLNKFKDLGFLTDSNVLKATQFGVPQQRERLFVVGVKKGCVKEFVDFLPTGFLGKDEYYTIADAFEDLEDLEPFTEITDKGIPKVRREINTDNNKLCAYLNDETMLLFNHIMTLTSEVARKRFEALNPGESFKNLSDDLKTTYSDPDRTQKTIYHRLDYTVPSRTVVNVRKSMWVHPRKHRAVSIREAARLQSFPDSYKFCGSKDSQYQQVGNAVPPLLGRAVAEQLLRVMGFEVEEPLSSKLGRDSLCAV